MVRSFQFLRFITEGKELLNMRQTLYWTWARPGAWMFFQPLELIR